MAPTDLEKLPLHTRAGQEQPLRKTSSRSVLVLAYLAVFGLLLLLVIPSSAVQRPWRDANDQATNQRHASSLPVDGNYPDGLSQPAVLTDATNYENKRESAPRRMLDEPIAPNRRDASSPSVAAAAAAPSVLECFQVAQPVLTPEGPTTSDGLQAGTGGSAPTESCTVLLMDHVFAWSYGKPFVGNYVPPKCNFNRVVLNFTVVSEGRQYDRLALMYFGDTEVWRTSTAEPTAHPGIRWVYLKDMTEYLYFWKTPQKLIFDLGNLIDEKYTGSFNTTLTATFFTSDVDPGNAPPSDLILPISARRSASDEPSAFTVPETDATNTISFPRNVNRAVFSVSACGQGDEEFWWQNLLQSDTWTFNATTGDPYPGFSPFREVQIYIDEQLAGVQWPFPVIFTGGVVPSFHRPIVGLDAFDLREHEIDITPWLPLLCDGSPHTFAIRVAGLDDDNGQSAGLTQSVSSNWIITGKVFLWLDDLDSITTGSNPVVTGAGPAIKLSHVVGQNATGANETLQYKTDVKRTFEVSAEVVSQKSSGLASWSQDLSYLNKGRFGQYGFEQYNDIEITGKDLASGLHFYSSAYDYPLRCESIYSVSEKGNLTIDANLFQGLKLQVSGLSVFPSGLEAFADDRKFSGGSLLDTHRAGIATFSQYGDRTKSTGSGHTTQHFRFSGLSPVSSVDKSATVELYFRNVTAVNDTVVYNSERLISKPQRLSTAASGPVSKSSGFRGLFAEMPVRGERGLSPSQASPDPGAVNEEQIADESTAQLGIEQSPMRR